MKTKRMNEWNNEYSRIVEEFGGVPDCWQADICQLAPSRRGILDASDAAEFDLIEQGILPDNGRSEAILALADAAFEAAMADAAFEADCGYENWIAKVLDF